MSPPNPTPEESGRRVRGHILFTIGVLLFLALAWKLTRVIEIIYVSALFAVVLMPIVTSIMKMNIRGYHPSRPVAILLLIAIASLLLTLFFVFALPPVLRDLRQFSNDLPQKIPDLVDKLKRVPLVNKIGIDAFAHRTEEAVTSTAGYVFTSLPLWLSHLLDILTSIFLCIYFMLEGENAYRFFLSLFEVKRRRRLEATLHRAELKMSKWLLGQGFLMLSLGVCSTIAFGILHVRYFVLLGVLMGLLNIIPIAGGIISILLASIVAAIDSWAKMFGVLIFYGIYLNIENGILIPRIMKSSVDLMGLTVLISLLIGTELAGVIGALVAVPTAALVTVLLNEYAVQRDW